MGLVATALLMTASGLAAPILIEERASKWTAYPADSLRQKVSVAIRAEFVVSPDGVIESCRVLSSEGPQNIARQLCAAQASKMFDAARNSDGQPTYGVVRTWVTFVVPGSQNERKIRKLVDEPDLLVTIPASASGNRSVVVKVSIQVGQGGKIVACQPRPTAAANAAVLATACAAISKLAIAPVPNHALSLGSYVIEQQVRFEPAN